MIAKKTLSFSKLLESYFVDYLMNQRHVSHHTISSYRDTFRLLLKYAKKQHHRPPEKMVIDNFNAKFIREFLNYLERSRGLSANSRNQRLAAIRSFFHYISIELPEKSNLIARVLAIPQKRHARTLIDFLSRNEIDVLLKQPDRSCVLGRRDYALILLAIQTGLRASELTNLRIEDIYFSTLSYIRCMGKGRKERTVPLTKITSKVIQAWIEEQNVNQHGYLFLSARGKKLSLDGLEYIIRKYELKAKSCCSSLQKKKITPHVLRHTTAMQLLQAGVDIAVIALWLGHESIETTHIYLEADLKLKEDALSKTAPPGVESKRFKANDKLLAFLDAL